MFNSGLQIVLQVVCSATRWVNNPADRADRVGGRSSYSLIIGAFQVCF